MPFNIISDLVLAALCATAMLSWMGRELADRARLTDRAAPSRVTAERSQTTDRNFRLFVLIDP